MRDLFRCWPKLAEVLACEEIADLPTPVVPLVGIHPDRAWMKCDDVAHRVYGGNKIRKLEFIIPDLKRRRVRQVVTLGGSGSNSGVAVAMVCRDLGIACRIYTFDQRDSDTVCANAALMRIFGAELVPCGSAVAAGLRYYLDPRRFDPRVAFLYAGCSNERSVFGYVNAMLELKRQVDAGECPMPDHVLVATGSCSTLAGLLLGGALLRWPLRISGVRVAPDYVGPFPGCTPGLVAALMRRALARLARVYPEYASLSLPTPNVIGEYYGDGYGLPTAAGERALAAARERAQLSLEGTYTAKAFAAVLDALERTNDRVLFLNTHNSRDTRGLLRAAG